MGLAIETRDGSGLIRHILPNRWLMRNAATGVLSVGLLLGVSQYAASKPSAPANDSAKSQDPLNRDSPQSSVISFLEAYQSRDVHAARYLDLRKFPRTERLTINGLRREVELERAHSRLFVRLFSVDGVEPIPQPARMTSASPVQRYWDLRLWILHAIKTAGTSIALPTQANRYSCGGTQKPSGASARRRPDQSASVSGHLSTEDVHV